jgi:diguanylate cyclase (GGDEF)-like protein
MEEGILSAIATMGTSVERRDLALRGKRDAVAAWFGIHPSELGSVAGPTIEMMAGRLEEETLQQAEVAGLRASAARWEQLAQTDSLTGLANRRAAEGRLAAELDRARRTGRPLAVLLGDVDDLKAVNDRYGHQAGDGVLKALASRLQRAVRRTDTAGRWGGDEFIVVLPDTGGEAAERVADKLLQMTNDTPVALPLVNIRVGVSVGWSVLGPNDDEASLLAAADEALYKSKAEGRARGEGPAAPTEVNPPPDGGDWSDQPPS